MITIAAQEAAEARRRVLGRRFLRVVVESFRESRSNGWDGNATLPVYLTLEQVNGLAALLDREPIE